MQRQIRYLVVAGVLAAGLCQSQAAPSIGVTTIPAYGAFPGVLNGRVTGVNPADYRVAALVFLSGLGFYTKPYCDATTTALGSDGSFSVLLTTGGIDQYATLIALLVVPASASVPCYSSEPGVPLALEQQAVAEVLVPRPNPAQRQIEFSGERWLVKSSPAPVGPGPNYFSDSSENVWVDGSGRLHLRITYRNGHWNCAEIYSDHAVGYGKYSFQMETVPQLDKNVVFGAFTWADAERVSREIDTLEVSRFGDAGDPNNAQNVVQPYQTPGNQMRFLLPAVTPTIHSMEWQADSASFRSVDGQAAVLHEWTYGGQPPSAESAGIRYRINLWLVAPPSDGQEVEVMLSRFSYTSNPKLFVPIAPCRVVDTRNAAGPYGGPAIAANTSRDFATPSGGCGIPSSALAYSFNVTAVPGASLLYLSMWPTGQPLPVVSTLNALDGRWTANAAIVPAGTNGSVSVFVSDTTHVVLDINGYFVPAETSGALAFYPLTPCRVIDTRGGASIAAGGTRTVAVRSSSCSVPSGAVAYSLNFTALPHGPLGWITTFPTGQAMPTASTLNAPTGTITANAAILTAGTNGSVDVYASDATDLLVDINGYFALPGTGGLSFYTLTPCRVADTRNPVGPFGGPALTGTRDYAAPSSACGVPSGAQAYSLNATVWPAAGFLNWLTLWPAGGAMPVVSTLNSWDGRLVANAAIVPTTTGSISAYASDLTQFIFDINGYFAP